MLQKAVMLIYIRQYHPFGVLYAQKGGGGNKLAGNGSALVLQVSFHITQQVSRKNKRNERFAFLPALLLSVKYWA
jgi:hypothetical protein